MEARQTHWKTGSHCNILIIFNVVVFPIKSHTSLSYKLLERKKGGALAKSASEGKHSSLESIITSTHGTGAERNTHFLDKFTFSYSISLPILLSTSHGFKRAGKLKFCKLIRVPLEWTVNNESGVRLEGQNTKAHLTLFQHLHLGIFVFSIFIFLSPPNIAFAPCAFFLLVMWSWSDFYVWWSSNDKLVQHEKETFCPSC